MSSAATLAANSRRRIAGGHRVHVQLLLQDERERDLRDCDALFLRQDLGAAQALEVLVRAIGFQHGALEICSLAHHGASLQKCPDRNPCARLDQAKIGMRVVRYQARAAVFSGPLIETVLAQGDSI